VLGRIIRLAACAGAGLVLGIAVYVGLVGLGALRNPFAAAASGDLGLVRSDRAGLRVLFVGNSFTYRNSMPTLVSRLAAADEDAQPIFTVEYTAAGWRLKKAAEDEGLTALLDEVAWDVVVLQEQSLIPSLPAAERRREMEPFAHALHRKIEATGAETLLFMTWGYDGGDDDVAGDTFAGMQARLAEGYSDLAAQLPARVAPVGLAWAAAMRGRPGVDLWGWDGKHPSSTGSYLAACVFYAMLSGRDPSASSFTGGIEPEEARYLRRVAADVATATLPVP
jgi:hypothetical protein